jgi:hypothetical protein
MTLAPVIRPLVASIVRGLVPGGDGADPLVFKALTFETTAYTSDDGVSRYAYEVAPVITGTGTLTEGRSSTMNGWVTDGTNTYTHEFAANEPVYQGGRVVRNLLTYSEDFSNAAWVTAAAGTGIAATVTGDYAEGADRVQLDLNGGTSASDFTLVKNQAPSGLPNPHNPLVSIEMKATDGASSYNVILFAQGTSGSSTFMVTVTGEWQRFSTYRNTRATTTNELNIGLYGDQTPASSDTADILVRNAQFENTTGQSDTTTPGEYVPTTTASAYKVFANDNSHHSVTSNVVTDSGTYTPLADEPYLVASPALTNSLTYSLPDATNWTETGTSVVGANTTGMDGASDSAVVLTDDDGSALEYITESGSIPADTNTNVLRLFVKKDATTTRFPAILLQLNVGADIRSYWHLNTSTGASTARGSNDASAAIDVRDTGAGWWEVLVSVANNGSAAGFIVYIVPADGTVFGTSSAAATGSITCGGCELHENKTIAQVRGAGPIFTSGSTATTNATDLSFDDANHDEQGGYYCEALFYSKDPSNNNTPKFGCIGVGFSGACLYFRDTNNISGYDGTNVASVTYTSANGTAFKLAVAYGGTNFRVNVDGSWGTAATFAGWTNSESKIRVGANTGFTGPPSSGEKNGVGLLRNIRRYDQAYTNAQNTINDLMA